MYSRSSDAAFDAREAGKFACRMWEWSRIRLLGADDWPAVGVPRQRPEGEGSAASVCGVVEMADEPLAVAFDEYGGVAGADEGAVALEQKRAAALAHVFAVLIEVGAGDAFAAGDADVVGAVDAAAAEAPVDEEVIVAAVAVNARRLDLVLRSQRVDRRVGYEAEARFRVELDEHEAAPEGAEAEPEVAVGVE